MYFETKLCPVVGFPWVCFISRIVGLKRSVSFWMSCSWQMVLIVAKSCSASNLKVYKFIWRKWIAAASWPSMKSVLGHCKWWFLSLAFSLFKERYKIHFQEHETVAPLRSTFPLSRDATLSLEESPTDNSRWYLSMAFSGLNKTKIAPNAPCWMYFYPCCPGHVIYIIYHQELLCSKKTKDSLICPSVSRIWLRCSFC